MSARGEQTETTEDLFHENVFFFINLLVPFGKICVTGYFLNLTISLN